MARRDHIGRPVTADRASVDDEESVYRWRARRLGVVFAPVVVLDNPGPIDAEAIKRGTVAMSVRGERTLFLAPDESTLLKVADLLRSRPDCRDRLRVATPTSIRAALRAAVETEVAAEAIDKLDRVAPLLSARRTITARQTLVGIVAVSVLGAAMVADTTATLLLVNVFAGAFFFAVAVLRFIAANLVGALGVRQEPPSPVSRMLDYPVYTVLVPLYREERVVPQLIAALDRLEWPADRLDIKLIVEADDFMTKHAVERSVRGPPYEIVVVPCGGPRTKPKALQFALSFARGDLVAVYDAEDQPHPRQLIEAFTTFKQEDADLACLQAPIVIDNGDESLIARLFAIEYSALFDGLLPALVALKIPLPLGGTSNHFRRSALEEVGGWDPFNVTEDADLGIRLARFGFRSRTLTLPTYEEAPATLMTWVRQRSRWFKGWIQTWLVHMRQPIRFARAVGLRQFVGFNLLSAGMIISALIHPICLASFFMAVLDPLSLWGDGNLFTAAVVGLNLFVLVAGYASVVSLAWRTLALRGRRNELPALFALPVYWLLIAAACARALMQVFVKPHDWEKTPHHGRRLNRRRNGEKPRITAGSVAARTL